MFNESDDILTVEEMCKILKMGKNNAYKLLDSGLIRAYRNGKNWRIPRLSVKEYVNRMISDDKPVLFNPIEFIGGN